MPASTLNDVFRYFQQKPISLEEFDQFYVNADSGRGALIFDQLKLRLAQDPEGSLKILFAGHRGCGKTTELVRLQKHVDRDFIVLNFSVLKELDILNIHYIELFIVTMEKLFELVQSKNIKIADEYIESIKNWVMSGEIQKVREKHFGADIETGIESGIDVPFLVKFFGRFKASAKASSSMKETLKTIIEPKLSELIWHCNRLITEIKNQLPDKNKKGLVIIIEDLDKVPMDRAEDIFYGHSAQLTQLNCHCIFTFPISLLYHIRYRAISNNYDKPLVLPMIRVTERSGEKCAKGIAVLEHIVGQRVDPLLFEPPALLKEMIRYSGGCLWDLFRLVRDAADNAVILGRNKINEEDFESAYLSLKADYERTIAENREKKISVDDYYEALRSCATDPEKKPKHTDVVLDLMSNLTILNYNGKNWCDVHPMIRNILKERKMIPT